MGDSIDGSSGAAQSAHDPETNRQRGFFGRIFDAIGPSDNIEDNTATDLPDQSPVMNGIGLLNLRRMRVEDVAIPKAEIHSVPMDIVKNDLVEVFRETGLTRLPVFEGTLDSPMGFINLKDLALKYGFNGTKQSFDLGKILRPLLYAPPSMPIGVLLQKMQNDRIHMALVIDEYGGVDGLVTIEDLIEQVIGEIEDEHDIDEGKFWTLEKPGCYLADARTPLEDFENETGFSLTEDIEDEEIETLGGLMSVLVGRIPTRGEVVLHPAGPEFEIVDADPRRVKRLRVRLPDHSDG